MLTKANVIDVKCAPAIGKVQMMSGICTKEAAALWAVKSGYPTVYFWKEHERVYADKRTRVIATESGQGLLEFVGLVAVVIIVILLLGSCGVPW